MTMHLLPVYYSTTNSNKKSRRSKSSKSEAAIKHEKWVAKMINGKVIDKKTQSEKWRKEYSEMLQTNRTEFKSAGSGIGNITKTEPKVYTGNKLLGIATMHKSNMVPVFNTKDAEDISRMRRG
jgi:hypothetical protein